MPETKPPAMPGTKRKQAAALAFNVRWMAEQFGAERIAFLTLTCGDKTPEGFQKISERRESSRRFNSLLTNVIRERYQCGVVVTERHRDGGLHFHVVCVVGGDIRGGIDYGACFPARACVCVRAAHFSSGQKPIAACASASESTCGDCGKEIPDYSTAPARLRLEWKFWRLNAEKFGFGRCQLQPMKKDGTALGFYVAKYISKDFASRCEDDIGGRCVRYFGRWSKDGHKFSPPMSARHGTMTAKARAWRKGLEWLTSNWRERYGARFNVGQETIKDACGPSWAFVITGWMRRVVWPELGREDEREAWRESNAEVIAANPKACGMENFSPSEVVPNPKEWREVTRAQWEARTWSEAQRWRYLDQTAIDAARGWAERLQA